MSYSCQAMFNVRVKRSSDCTLSLILKLAHWVIMAMYPFIKLQLYSKYIFLNHNFEAVIVPEHDISLHDH